MLIEAVSHRSYARYLEDEVLHPLRLAATGYDVHSLILPERASGYLLRDGLLQNADYLDMSVPFSAGGLFSTVDDLLQWNLALHGGQLLRPDFYQKMVAEYPETKKSDGHYVYGLFITERSGNTFLSHSGGVNGFMSVVEYCPALQASLILLSNLFDPRALQVIYGRLSGLLT